MRHRGLVVYLHQELGTDDWCSFRVYTIRVSGDVGRTCMKHVIWHISSSLDRARLSVGMQHLRMIALMFVLVLVAGRAWRTCRRQAGSSEQPALGR